MSVGGRRQGGVSGSAEIVHLAGGRPYYLRKLGYYTFDAAANGRVTRAEFAATFERSFASVPSEDGGSWPIPTNQ